MAVQRDYNKPLHEEEPYLVQNKHSTDLSRLQTTTDWYGNPITDPDRSNPTRNRHESPLQTIMSFEYAISKEESINPSEGITNVGDMMATRPGTAATNRRYSAQPQPSRRTSSYSAYGAASPQPYHRQEYPREREYPPPPVPQGRERTEYRESNGESSSTSSYNQPYGETPHPTVGYPPQQEYSPPTTPTRPQQFGNVPQQSTYYPQHTAQYPAYGIPSPEPEVDTYPRQPVKPPVHSFVSRPVTPPTDNDKNVVAQKKTKLSKLKRFSGFGKSKD